MTFKTWWQRRSYWQKGGIVGLMLGIFFGIIPFFVDIFCIFSRDIDKFCQILFWLSFDILNYLFFLTTGKYTDALVILFGNIAFSPLLGLILGLFLGFLIGKVKGK